MTARHFPMRVTVLACVLLWTGATAAARPAAKARYYVTLSVANPRLLANGMDTSRVTCHVLDAADLSPAQGVSVRFEADWSVVDPPTVATDASGVAVWPNYATNEEGVYNVYATVAGVEHSAPVSPTGQSARRVAAVALASEPGSASSLAAATAPAGARREPSVYPVLDQDRRLAKTITLEGAMVPLGQIIRELHRQLGVELAVQGDLFAQPTVIQVKDREARDILTDIGLLARATWINRKGVYLLLADAQTAAAVSGFSRPQETERLERALVSSLTPQQMARLERTGVIKIADLAPAQRHLLGAVLAHEFFEHPDRHPRSMLNGEEAEIRLATDVTPNGLGGGKVVFLCAPLVSSDGKTHVSPFAEFPLGP